MRLLSFSGMILVEVQSCRRRMLPDEPANSREVVSQHMGKNLGLNSQPHTSATAWAGEGQALRSSCTVSAASPE